MNSGLKLKYNKIYNISCEVGTTCKVAKYLNRSFIGFEMSEDYYNTAKSRIFDNV